MGIHSESRIKLLKRGSTPGAIPPLGGETERTDSNFLLNDGIATAVDLGDFALATYSPEMTLEVYNAYVAFTQSPDYLSKRNTVQAILRETETFNTTGRKYTSLHSNANPVRGERATMDMLIGLGLYTANKVAGYTDFRPTDLARAFATIYMDFGKYPLYAPERLMTPNNRHAETTPLPNKLPLGRNSYPRIDALGGHEILYSLDRANLLLDEPGAPGVCVADPKLSAVDSAAIAAMQQSFSKTFKASMNPEGQKLRLAMKKSAQRLLERARRADLAPLPAFSEEASYDGITRHRLLFPYGGNPETILVSSGSLRAIADATGTDLDHVEFRLDSTELASPKKHQLTLFVYDGSRTDGKKTFIGALSTDFTPQTPAPGAYISGYRRREATTFQNVLAFYRDNGLL